MNKAFIETEEQFHLTAVAWLERALPIDAVLHHSPNEGQHKIQYRVKQVKKGMKPGFPDLIIFYRGRTILVELKSANGTVSRSQKDLHRKLIGCGITVFVTSSVDDLVDLIHMLIPETRRVSS